MRRRGPLEYDKFILNVFQIVDAINYRLQELQSENDLTNHISDLQELYSAVSDLSENLYLQYNIHTR